MDGILKGRYVGKERPSHTQSKNCEASLLGCWGADGTDCQPVLFFAQWEGRLRGMAWGVVVRLGWEGLEAWLMTVA